MKFDSKISFKAFYKLTEARSRKPSTAKNISSRKVGARHSGAPDVDYNPEDSEQDAMPLYGAEDERNVVHGEPTRTRGKKAATQDVTDVAGTASRANRAAEKKLDPKTATKITTRTFKTKGKMDKDIEEYVEIPQSLSNQAKQEYGNPDFRAFHQRKIPARDIGGTLRSIFEDDSFVDFLDWDNKPSNIDKANKVKCKSGSIEEIVNLLIDGYKRFFPESVMEVEFSEKKLDGSVIEKSCNAITNVIRNADHYYDGSHYEDDELFDPVYNLDEHYVFRRIEYIPNKNIKINKKDEDGNIITEYKPVPVRNEDGSPKRINVRFPVYSTYKLERVGGKHSKSRQVHAYGRQGSMETGARLKR